LTSVEQLIKQNQHADLLRITTAGSVDDGKSTLIGRLLYEAKGIFEDQLDSIRAYSAVNRKGEFDYALVTDGLKSEREQGITIDVAYRFFSTPKRRFIIADTPGHVQYTRNMATGASNSQLALILVDATKGVTIQTKRHTFISSLLGIGHYVVAVNKMDLVGYSEKVFENIVETYREYTDKLPIDTVTFIPVSALKGDNVVEESNNMPWYKGSPLLDYLETVTIVGTRNLIDFRFPVQHAIWSGDGFRGYAGTVASGIIRKGEEVLILPSKQRSAVKDIITYEGSRSYAFSPQPVTIVLEDELDIGRGDMIVRPKNLPYITDTVEANLVWMNEIPMEQGKTYLFKHTNRIVRGTIEELKYLFNPEDLHRQEGNTLHLNEIGKATVKFLQPLYADEYRDNSPTGSFIVIDPISNLTLAAGMITKCVMPEREAAEILPGKPKKAITYWQLVPEGAKADTFAPKSSEPTLELRWDELERGLNADLGNNESSLPEKLRRVAEICKVSNQNGLCVTVKAPVKPTAEVWEIIGAKNLILEK